MKKIVILMLSILMLTSCGKTTENTTTPKPKEDKPKSTLSGCYILREDIELMPEAYGNITYFGKDSYSATFYCFTENSYITGHFSYILNNAYTSDYYIIYDELYNAHIASGKDAGSFTVDSKEIAKRLNEDDYDYYVLNLGTYIGRYSIDNNTIRMAGTIVDNFTDFYMYAEGNIFIGKNDIALEKVDVIETSYSSTFFLGDPQEKEEKVFVPFELADFETYTIEVYDYKTDKSKEVAYDVYIEKLLKTVDKKTEDLQKHVDESMDKELEITYKILKMMEESTESYDVDYTWKHSMNMYTYDYDYSPQLIIESDTAYIEYNDYADMTTVCHVDFKTGKALKKPIRELFELEVYSCDTMLDDNDALIKDLKKILKTYDLTLEEISLVTTK